MTSSFDTSVVLAALMTGASFHEECNVCLEVGGGRLYSHGLSEAFNVLTGGRLGFQVPASIATRLLEQSIVSVTQVVTLTPREMLKAMSQAEERGVRGGAVFDYLHLVAARKAKSERFVTLNERHFRAFWRHGDPAVVHPGEG